MKDDLERRVSFRPDEVAGRPVMSYDFRTSPPQPSTRARAIQALTDINCVITSESPDGNVIGARNEDNTITVFVHARSSGSGYVIVAAGSPGGEVDGIVDALVAILDP